MCGQSPEAGMLGPVAALSDGAELRTVSFASIGERTADEKLGHRLRALATVFEVCKVRPLSSPFSPRKCWALQCAAALVLVLLPMCLSLRPQNPLKPKAPSSAPATTQPETPEDPLGRTTPRGTVLGFLSAARKGNDEVAAQYLNTSLRGKAAGELAHKLFVVLDRLLPAQLNKIADTPEGSPRDLPSPNQELVGVIKGARGETDVVVERVSRRGAGQIWLFSRPTLNSIPGIYDEITRLPTFGRLPDWLLKARFGETSLYELLVILLGMPLVYFLTGLIGRLIGGLVNVVRRLSRAPLLSRAQILPPPFRLILLGLAIHWMLHRFRLPLVARQFWVTVAGVLFISAGTWFLILFTSWLEKRTRRWMLRRNLSGADSMPRLLGGVGKALFVAAGLLAIFGYFGVNLTAALAGLGVGGIAVALAAQKTLENLIGGASLVFDQAVAVGEFVKIGDALGTVEEIGLRSIRVRTLDRTMLRLPNGQVANMVLESYTARDKFWLHPILRLKYGISSAQTHTILDSIRGVLTRSPDVEDVSARVRLLNFAPSFMEIEVFAYVIARDWSGFLEIQEGLLLGMMECIEAAGAEIAIPSQTVFLVPSSASARGGDGQKPEKPSPEKKPGEKRTAAKTT